jgi:hypothetical protein
VAEVAVLAVPPGEQLAGKNTKKNSPAWVMAQHVSPPAAIAPTTAPLSLCTPAGKISTPHLWAVRPLPHPYSTPAALNAKTKLEVAATF